MCELCGFLFQEPWVNSRSQTTKTALPQWSKESKLREISDLFQLFGGEFGYDMDPQGHL